MSVYVTVMEAPDSARLVAELGVQSVGTEVMITVGSCDQK